MAVYIYKKKYITAGIKLHYSLGSSELDDRIAVGVLVKIFGMLDMTPLTRKSGD